MWITRYTSKNTSWKNISAEKPTAGDWVCTVDGYLKATMGPGMQREDWGGVDGACVCVCTVCGGGGARLRRGLEGPAVVTEGPGPHSILPTQRQGHRASHFPLSKKQRLL